MLPTEPSRLMAEPARFHDLPFVHALLRLPRCADGGVASGLAAAWQLPASTGLPPLTALTAASGIDPLAGLSLSANLTGWTLPATIAGTMSPGPATALGGLAAAAGATLAEPMRFALLFLAALTVVLALGAAALSRMERAATKRLSHWFGWRSVLVTGWVGTPIHELSHLAACKLLGLRVVDYRLFQPDPRTTTLGYVHYVQEGTGPTRALRRFVVGTAPLAVGLAILTTGWVLLLQFRPPSLTVPLPTLISNPMPLVQALLAQVATPLSTKAFDWRFVLWAYFAMSVGVHMAPSKADLKNATFGLMAFWTLALAALVGFCLLTTPATVASLLVPGLLTITAVLSWTSLLAAVYLTLVWIASRIAAR